jgi:hypothetical protein
MNAHAGEEQRVKRQEQNGMAIGEEIRKALGKASG